MGASLDQAPIGPKSCKHSLVGLPSISAESLHSNVHTVPILMSSPITTPSVGCSHSTNPCTGSSWGGMHTTAAEDESETRLCNLPLK